MAIAAAAKTTAKRNSTIHRVNKKETPALSNNKEGNNSCAEHCKSLAKQQANDDGGTRIRFTATVKRHNQSRSQSQFQSQSQSHGRSGRQRCTHHSLTSAQLVKVQSDADSETNCDSNAENEEKQ